MTSFVMRDRKASSTAGKPVFNQRVFHGAHSSGKVEIKGNWQFSGPQPVGEGGVPEKVVAIFDQYPHVQRIAITFETPDGAERGVVYSRLDHEVSEG